MKVLSLFLLVAMFSFVPQDSHAIRKAGCCTPQKVKNGEQCDIICRENTRANSRSIKNAQNVPCCDTPGLNPAWQCNMECSAFERGGSHQGVRRCTPHMRKIGRCN